jgi:O-antigen/teichoic acid export membrane protein
MPAPANTANPAGDLSSGRHQAPDVNLTSTARLTRNIIWNLVGEAAPFGVAFVAIPVLIRALGIARFGILTIVWSLLTYFGIFDMGVGRAMTKLIADQTAASNRERVVPLFWTGIALMAGAGIIVAIIAAPVMGLVVARSSTIPRELHAETIRAGYALTLALPLIISGAGLRGTLAALQRFDLINLIDLPGGAMLFLAPLLVLPFTSSLFAIVLALLFVRVIGWFAGLYFCWRAIPQLLRSFALDRGSAASLLSFGGWVMISNVVGPIMVYSDRFFIASLISLEAVVFYTTPFELLFRLSIIPSALTAVLFPAMAESLVLKQTRTPELFDRGSKAILFAVFPILLVTATFAHWGLEEWLSAAFAAKSGEVLKWLSLGILINSSAWVAFAMIQALHRPDITGKLHLAEVVVYLPLLCWLIQSHGIKGAAIAWTLRAGADTAVLLWIAVKLLPSLAKHARSSIYLTATGAGALALTMVLPASAVVRTFFLASCLLATVVCALPEVEWLVTQLNQSRMRSGLLSE